VAEVGVVELREIVALIEVAAAVGLAGLGRGYYF
jgi:hypothetical protein